MTKILTPTKLRLHTLQIFAILGRVITWVGLDLRVQRPLEKLYRDFLVLHDRVYGHSVEAAVRIVNLRSVHRLAQFLQYPSFLLIKVIVSKVVDRSLLILRSNV